MTRTFIVNKIHYRVDEAEIETGIEVDTAASSSFSKEETLTLFRQPSFVLLLLSFAMVMGAQCAVFSLLAQILSPSFELENNVAVGLLGSVMLLIGVLPSILIGKLLDATHRYMLICRLLYASVLASIIALTVSAGLAWFTLAVAAW